MSNNSTKLKPILQSADAVNWTQPLPGEKIAIRIDGCKTGQRFAVAEAIVAPQAGPPLHIHHDTDEIIYVLDGTVDFVCEGEHFQTGPGGMVLVPRGARHAFRNFGSTPARLLGVFLPGGFEQLFAQMDGRPASDITALAADHGMEVVGPPIDYMGSVDGSGSHLHAEVAV